MAAYHTKVFSMGHVMGGLDDEYTEMHGEMKLDDWLATEEEQQYHHHAPGETGEGGQGRRQHIGPERHCQAG